jgi:hypothetical protein
VIRGGERALRRTICDADANKQPPVELKLALNYLQPGERAATIGIKILVEMIIKRKTTSVRLESKNF